MAAAAGAVDEAVREYLLFRGFAKTLQTFEAERKNDPEKGLQADAIVAQLIAYVEAHELAPLLNLWRHLDIRFFSRLEYSQVAAAEKLEDSLKKFYLTHAVAQNQPSKVSEFFQLQARELRGREEWQEWFALPYIKSPAQQPPFSKYFRRPWIDTFTLSLHNFLASIFQHLPLPALLNFSSEHDDSAQLASLRAEVSRLQAQVSELQQASSGKQATPDTTESKRERRKSIEMPPSAIPPQIADAVSSSSSPAPRQRSATARGSLGRSGTPPSGEKSTASPAPKSRKGKERPRRAPFVILSQEVYAGHRSGSTIVTCQFARSGDNVLSIDDQGGVRLWHAPTMGPILSLEVGDSLSSACWLTEKSLLVVHTDGRFQSYGIHSDRPVTDFLLDSPGRPLLAASRPDAPHVVCAVHDAASSKSFLALVDLEKQSVAARIEADVVPHPVHDMCFNGNGSLLAVACSDGRLRVLDVDGGAVIREFEAGPGPVTACRFSADDTKVYTCGPKAPLRIWTSGEDAVALSAEGAANQVALLQEGDFCVVAQGGAPMAKIFSTSAAEGSAEAIESLLTIEQHSANVTAIDARGSTVLTGDAAGGVQVTLLLSL